jgi:hypothetical protein
MRRALTLFVLAASTALAFPADAQNRGGDRAERRAERQEQRQTQRVQRQQQRIERRQARPAPVVRNNGNTARQQRTLDRLQRIGRENALRYGTREQRREIRREDRAVALQGNRRDFRQERREDRREFRQERRGDRRDLRQGNVTREQFRRDRRDDRRDYRQDRREDRRDFRQDRREWNRDWRRDNRYNWQGHRNQYRNVFRAPRYYAPYRNYSYRRFGIGVMLDSLFWGRNYWIADPWTYRLPPAGPGYQWVRYYNDVLLVDTYSGQVVDVIYDFFW